METLNSAYTKSTPINIFLIGNNPLELSGIYEKLNSLRHKQFTAEIGFGLKGLYKKIVNNNPACILIDDNFDSQYVKNLVKRLSKNIKTKDIPITIIKNSNYKTTYIDGAQEYILKDGITAEGLSKSILNAIRLKTMHQYLYTSYKKKKMIIRDLLHI